MPVPLFFILLIFHLELINGGVLLGETCASDSDCSASFSLCIQLKCTCIKGFTQDGKEKCISTTVQCPHIGVVSKPQKCLTHENSTNGGCPNEFYCLIYESTVFGIGHCCPKPQLLCPAGLPDPVNTCAKDMPNKCDSSTHLCHGLSFGARNRDRDVEVCCKKPCANEEFYSEGKCYKTRHFGQTCEIDQQCQVKGSICKKGACACPDGQTFNFNSQTYIEFCSELTKLAAPTPEVEAESNSSIRVFLSESCSLTDSSRLCAASFSLCVNGTCQCASGFVPDGKATCKPQSFSCPFIGRITKPTICTIKENPVQKYGSVGYIDTCPSGHQCLTYNGKDVGFGHCCPVDPLFCPIGSPDLNYESGKCVISANIPVCGNASHFCISTYLNSQRYGDTCCPSPCPKDHILRNNKCLPTERQEGESCEVQEQCLTDGKCQNGTCQCPKTHFNHKVLKVCMEAKCPNVKLQPQFAPIAAPVSPDGSLLRCKDDPKKCPKAMFCDYAGEFCCPIPEIKCANPESGKHAVPQACDPDKPKAENSCDSERQFCKATYTEGIRANGTIIQKANGICCPNEQ